MDHNQVEIFAINILHNFRAEIHRMTSPKIFEFYRDTAAFISLTFCFLLSFSVSVHIPLMQISILTIINFNVHHKSSFYWLMIILLC